VRQFRNILVGVNLSHADRLAAADLNPPTEEAIKRALWLAEKLSARVTFFAALDLSAHTLELLGDDSAAASKNVEDEANQVLAALVERAKAVGVDADSKLIFGTPWLEIIRQVLREQHDLVVVGTRGLGKAGRMLFGSTGIKLVRKCPCPVWVTRPDPNWDDLNILVASDLCDVSSHALDTAVGGAQLADAKVHLLHVLDVQFDRHLARTGISDEQILEYHQRARADAERALHEQLSHTDYRTLTQGIQVHVKEGQADIVILDAIQEWNIDLLVMGTVGRRGIPGLLLGNTAERLLPEITCSLLAVKPDDFQCPIAFD